MRYCINTYQLKAEITKAFICLFLSHAIFWAFTVNHEGFCLIHSNKTPYANECTHTQDTRAYESRADSMDLC